MRKTSDHNAVRPLPFGIDRRKIESYSDQVFAGIRRAIETGYYREGDVLPSRDEIAAALGVSVRVPRAAFARLTAAGLVVPRPGVGCQVLSKKHPLWRGHVVFVVAEEGGYYFTQFSGTLQRTLRKKGWQYTRVSVPFHRRRADLSGLEELSRQGVDFAVVYASGAVGGDVERQVSQLGIPFLSVGGAPEDVPNRLCRAVHDYTDATTRFARHCTESGVGSVLSLDDSHAIASILRRQGVEVEMLASLRRGVDCTFAEFMRSGIGPLERRLSDRRKPIPQLVFFSDDYQAMGAFPVLLERGLAIPDRVRVVTFANKGFGPVWREEFTRIEVDPVADARAIVKAVIACMTGGAPGDSVRLGVRYVIGGTFPRAGR